MQEHTYSVPARGMKNLVFLYALVFPHPRYPLSPMSQIRTSTRRGGKTGSADLINSCFVLSQLTSDVGCAVLCVSSVLEVVLVDPHPKPLEQRTWPFILSMTSLLLLHYNLLVLLELYNLYHSSTFKNQIFLHFVYKLYNGHVLFYWSLLSLIKLIQAACTKLMVVFMKAFLSFNHMTHHFNRLISLLRCFSCSIVLEFPSLFYCLRQYISRPWCILT